MLSVGNFDEPIQSVIAEKGVEVQEEFKTCLLSPNLDMFSKKNYNVAPPPSLPVWSVIFSMDTNFQVFGPVTLKCSLHDISQFL